MGGWVGGWDGKIRKRKKAFFVWFEGLVDGFRLGAASYRDWDCFLQVDG